MSQTKASTEEETPLKSAVQFTKSEEADLLSHIPDNDDTQCAVPLLQWFASKKTFAILFGLTGCFYSATYMYYTGTITTMEKRYQIQSKNTGLILVGHDLVQIFSAVVLAYFAAKGHRPRWMALGALTMALYCFLMMVPHWLYGAGDDAFALSREYATAQVNLTAGELRAAKMKDLCDGSRGEEDCTKPPDSNTAPQIILFIANMVSGLAGPLYFNLGFTYMDDNVKKSKSPVYFSLTSFLRMIGPPLGAAVAAFFLKIYIAPSLTPMIDNSDPRWMGAWWAGWMVFMVYFLITAVAFWLFPRILPRAALRRKDLVERILKGEEEPAALKVVEKASLEDIKATCKRLATNRTYVFNLLAGCFYCFGYLPFWTYQGKYIEAQYLLSASTASLVTGTVSLVFSSIGILSSGLVISKFKPKARSLAMWNVCTSAVSILGVIGYVFNGCVANDSRLILQNSNVAACNQECHCDYIKYSPVCGLDNKTYISPCHAGCTDKVVFGNGTVLYTECSCIVPPMSSIDFEKGFIEQMQSETLAPNRRREFKNEARGGVCPVDCMQEFYMFFIILCINKFIGGTEGSSNFLLGIRCVDERDRTVSMGINITVISILALMPSPILFGALMDSTCVLWGKTCSKKGNCWLYDAEAMRYRINLTAAVFVAFGTLLDIGTWYHSKNVQIFDKEDETDKNVEVEMNIIRRTSVA